MIPAESSRHGAQPAPTAIALAPPRLRALRLGVRLRQRQRQRRLLVYGRRPSPADARGSLGRLPVPGLPARPGIGREGAHRMMHRVSRAGALGAALLGLMAAVLPAAAAEISIIGRWQIVEAVPGPWVPADRQAELAAEGKRLLKTEVTFAADSLASKFKPFSCKSKVIYEANLIEVDALFQGNLPEPNPAAAAARLGFPKGDIPSMDVRCLKAQYTFHFRDPNTALMNLDRVIYTFKRQ
jgi:hypothetical protein